ncbi:MULTISPECIES: hypothetical protein [Streptomyces]|uniref:Uncharacterized protein n=1 Tax=Streptomyces celluloflavus TaxID=58344 RepID=A0ABW7REL2_9ACTN|nr:hypothetical protein [Streptomyces kasugaensis]
MAKVRDRGEVLGFGVPAVLFLPGVAYLGITNGHQFIANDFLARAFGAVDDDQVVPATGEDAARPEASA